MCKRTKAQEAKKSMKCEYPVDSGTCGTESRQVFRVVGEDWTRDNPGFKCLCQTCQEQVKEEGYELTRISKRKYEASRQL
jgi:hypothetical protein